MNRFGAVYTDVPPLYQGSVVDDYGGQAVIETALDRATDAIVASCSETIFTQLSGMDLLQIVRRGVAGVTVLPAPPILPLVEGSVRVWRGDSSQFQVRPAAGGTGPGLPDLPSSLFSVDHASGVVTLVDALVDDELVYLSAEVNTDSAGYSVPSIARQVAIGAAGQLGEVLYSEGTQEWRLVEAYRQTFSDYLAGLRAGTIVPSEVRKARFFAEVSPSGSRGGSIELVRG